MIVRKAIAYLLGCIGRLRLTSRGHGAVEGCGKHRWRVAGGYEESLAEHQKALPCGAKLVFMESRATPRARGCPTTTFAVRHVGGLKGKRQPAGTELLVMAPASNRVHRAA